MKTKPIITILLLTCFSALNPQLSAAPIGTAFTYQGRLTDGANPATGTYDLRFTIYDALSGPSQIGPALTNAATAVSNGLFTVSLDFGAGVFDGNARWLDIAVRTNGSVSFSTLSPRQPLTPAPHALYAPNAGFAAAATTATTATTATSVSGTVAASQLTGAISSNNIGAGSITATMLAAGSVTSSKLAAGAVTTSALQDGAVTAAKVSVTTAVTSLTTFTNPTPAFGDSFGYSVAAVGSDKVLIGAHSDDTGATDAGAAYLFGTNGTLLTTFTKPTPVAGDYFGISVAAVGSDRVLIGAFYDNTGATDAGAAYLFDLAGNLVTAFTNPTPADSEMFGDAVAGVGSDRVLIGAPNAYTGTEWAGAAYLFSTNGTLLTTFTNPTPADSDYFGRSVVAVGTNRVLIGAYRDDIGATDAGAAYLFDLTGNLLTTFTNPTPAVSDRFGLSMAAVGSDRVLIGAYGDDTGATDAGAAYLFGTNGTLLTTFTNPTPADSDSFGISVAAVGSDRVLIGAHWDDTGANNAGAVYLFSTNGMLLATFTNPTPADNDYFGSSVAAVGNDRVLIGANSDDTGATDAGAAYLFSVESYTPGLVAEGVRHGAITADNIAAGAVGSAQLATGAVTTSALQDGAVTAAKVAVTTAVTTLTTFTNPTPAVTDLFGGAVAAVGSDKVLIGARFDDTGAEDAGAAYLFSANGTLLTTFTNPTPAYFDMFGIAVAAVGSDRVLIGAANDDTGATDAGAAYLFGLTGNLITTFTNPTPAGSDNFGYSVAGVGNDRVLIGARYDDTGATDAGAAYLFSTNGTLITTFTNPTPVNNDYFGCAVAAVGLDKVLIGAYYDHTGPTNAGAAFLFSTNGTLLTTFNNPTPEVSDFFGWAVAAVGSDRVLIGAPYDDTGAADAGAAYLFDLTGNLLTTFTNPTPEVGDFFGFSVAAAGSDRVLIGAYRDDTGVANAGAAYLFSTNGTLITTITNPFPAVNDQFGSSVAAAGADRLLIGAPYDNTGATDAGKAYLFSVDSYTPGLMAQGVRRGAITADSIAAGAVGSAQLASNAVTSANIAAGAVGGAQIASNAVTSANLADGAVTSAAIADGSISAADVNAGSFSNVFWKTDGNAGTTPGAQFVGTTDNQPLELKVNNQRGLRLEPTALTDTVNVIGGSARNFVGAGVVGATIGGGGSGDYGAATNRVEANFGTVSGGLLNTIQPNASFATIGGGSQNRIYTNASNATIVGGQGNTIQLNAYDATVAGGRWNDIGTNSNDSAIGGGNDNNIAANSTYATIAGGIYNNIGVNCGDSAIGGGSQNTIADNSYVATIAGGNNNDIGTNSQYSAIGGGYDNNIAANAGYATIAGGYWNYIGTNSDYSAIGGGYNNNIAGDLEYATIAGGCANDIGTYAYESVIGGGYGNNIAANSSCATIAGGFRNGIGTNAYESVIGGGASNTIAAVSWTAIIAGGDGNGIGNYSDYSAIGGGKANNIAASSWSATIAGGYLNYIGTNSDYSAIGGGSNNTIAGYAPYATIPGGRENAATNYAFAAGYNAKATNTGAFVWSDSTGTVTGSTNNNSVTFRASGGYRFFTGTGSSGAFLAAGGGSWTSMSDRNAKTDFESVDAAEVLAKVTALPLTTWRYKSQDASVRHLGPMAQDFKAAFAVGESDTGITSVDADGVALAAIQGLNEKVDSENAALRQELQRRDTENAELKRELGELKTLVKQLVAQPGN